ncbi:unnamed protein product [Nezara viridula]|uniref:Uncharacterized protein n=1 Tax=Nezara viridula TaxID=85310 RepID=A0A9P0HNY2_NEZVI|nr:unnamed protein product [Nezara viridula]
MSTRRCRGYSEMLELSSQDSKNYGSIRDQDRQSLHAPYFNRDSKTVSLGIKLAGKVRVGVRLFRDGSITIFLPFRTNA